MDILAKSDMLFVLIPALIGLGCISGFLAGLLGIGGGVILVPGLLYLFQALGFETAHLMHMAVGTSLAVIVVTGSASARAHFRRGAVDLHLVWRIGLGILVGAAAGVTLAGYLPGLILKIIFALSIMILAVLMAAGPGRFSLSTRQETRPGLVMNAGAGVIIGAISSLIGIGGASLSVPYMSAIRVPIHKAIGTAAALGLLIAVPASTGFVIIGWDVPTRPPLALGYIHLPSWIFVALAGVFAAPLGARMAHKMPVEIMRKGFALFLMVVAVKMALEVFGGG